MKRKNKKILVYFLPITFIQVLLCWYDNFLASKINISNIYLEKRIGMIHSSIYLYFFIIPVYLMITNIKFNVKHDINNYYKDLKLIYAYVMVCNILALIFNIVCNYIYNTDGLNCFLEFIFICVPQFIMIGVFGYLGSFFIKRKEENQVDDNLLEKYMIEKQQVDEQEKLTKR